MDPGVEGFAVPHRNGDVSGVPWTTLRTADGMEEGESNDGSHKGGLGGERAERAELHLVHSNCLKIST